VASGEERGLLCLPTSQNAGTAFIVYHMSDEIYSKRHVICQPEKLINIFGVVNIICNGNEDLVCSIIRQWF
jgi:hypothetical protein